MTRNETARQTIRQIAANWEGEETLADAIRTAYNCREVSVSEDGSVWIADPQAGHWLSDDDLIALPESLANCGYAV